MKTQSLFLILLITTSMATSLFQKYPINYSSKRNLFKVLSEVRSKIASGGPLSAVIELLDDLKSEVQNEQSTHDAVSQTQQAQCQTEIDFRNNEISDANDSISSANSQLASCEGSLTRAQADLSNNVITQQDLNDQKSQLDMIRKKEETNHLEKVQDHNDAIDSIEVALELLDEIFSGEESFMQLSTLSTKMLKHAIKLRATKHYAPVISIFAQIAAKKVLADSVALEKVRQLLQNLKTNIQNSLSDYQSQETNAVEVYNQRTSNIDESLAELTSTEENLREQIQSLENCVASQNSIISSATSKLNRNTNLMDQAQTMCDNFQEEYKDSTSKRYNSLCILFYFILFL